MGFKKLLWLLPGGWSRNRGPSEEVKGVIQAEVNGSLDQSSAVGMESRGQVQEMFWRVKRPALGVMGVEVRDLS